MTCRLLRRMHDVFAGCCQATPRPLDLGAARQPRPLPPSPALLRETGAPPHSLSIPLIVTGSGRKHRTRPGLGRGSTSKCKDDFADTLLLIWASVFDVLGILIKVADGYVCSSNDCSES